MAEKSKKESMTSTSIRTPITMGDMGTGAAKIVGKSVPTPTGGSLPAHNPFHDKLVKTPATRFK